MLDRNITGRLVTRHETGFVVASCRVRVRGTTALAASVLGRLGISVDLSSDYTRLAKWRTTDPGERARAMRVDKPPKPIDGQIDLFGEAS